MNKFWKRGVSVILCCMIAWIFFNFFSTVSLQIYLPALAAYKGWEYADLLMWNTYGNLIGVVFTLLSGSIVRKIGPKKSIIIFSLICGLNYSLVCFYPSSLIGIGVIINAVAHIFYCTVPTAIILGNWFPRKNETITGYVTGAIIVGSLVFLPLMTWLNNNYGIPVAMAVFGIIIFVYGLICIRWVVVTPEEVGLDPDGIPYTEEEKLEKAEKEKKAATEKCPWTYRKILTNKSFLLVGLGFGLEFLALVGFSSVGVPAMTSKGLDAGFATTIAALSGVMNLIGSVVSGWIAARIGTKRTTLLFFVGTLVASLMIAFAGPSSLMVAVVGYFIFMAALGAPNNLLMTQALRLSGPEYYGTVFGVLFAVVNLLRALGSSVVSVSLRLTNSYTGALIVFAAVVGVACISQLFAEEKVQEP